MKKIALLSTITFFFFTTNAQNGNVGIGTNLPKARLHVVDSSVVFEGGAAGLLSSANETPVTGPGSRMMWYRDKSAFRSGLITGHGWDRDFIGPYSFAAGYNAIAGGYASLSIGLNNNAAGETTAAVGGVSNIARGKNSFASGEFSYATGYGSFVIGIYNDSVVSAQTSIQPTTPLFIIGNGTSVAFRSNAMIVRKDGSTTINGSLEVNSLKINNGALANAVLTSDAAGNANWSSVNSLETDPTIQTATANTVAKWNGTALVNSTIEDNGSSIIMGNGAAAGTGYKATINGGGIYADGDLKIAPGKAYRYASAQSRSISIPSFAFQLASDEGHTTPGVRVASAGYTNNGGGIYLGNGTDGVPCYLRAPLYLPDSAVIQDIILYVRDQNTTYDVAGQIIEFDPSIFSENLVTVIPGTTNSPGNTSISSTGINYLTRTNKNYYITFSTFENLIGLRIFGAKVNYTVLKVE